MDVKLTVTICNSGIRDVQRSDNARGEYLLVCPLNKF